MFAKIILSILAFLLTIFPNSRTLLTQQQSWSFPGKSVVSQNIVDAINAGDTDALMDMMSLDTKQNMEDLRGHVEELMNAIDGEIIEGKLGGGGYSSSESGTGQAIRKESWEWEIKTATSSYELDIYWIIVHSHAPQEVGLCSLSLYDSENNLLVTTYHTKA